MFIVSYVLGLSSQSFWYGWSAVQHSISGNRNQIIKIQKASK